MTSTITLHCDAKSELPFEFVTQKSVDLLASHCLWNNMRCYDQREQAALKQFYLQAEVNVQSSGSAGQFDGDFEDHLIRHCTHSDAHVILLANNSLFAQTNKAWQQVVFNLKSGRHQALAQAGHQSGKLRLLVHQTGSAFAGLSVLQRALLTHLQRPQSNQKMLIHHIEQMCRHTVNISLVDVSQLSFALKKQLGLKRLAKGFALIKLQQDQMQLLTHLEQKNDVLTALAQHIAEQRFLVPNVQLSRMSDELLAQNLTWQQTLQKLQSEQIELTTTLPSLAAMLIFGKQVINVGWIELT